MHKKITFRGMDSSPVIEEHVNKLIDKIFELLTKQSSPIYVDLILEASKNHAHNRAELMLKTPLLDLVSKYEGTDLYDVINRVFHVMLLEIKKHKGIEMDKHRLNNKRIM